MEGDALTTHGLASMREWFSMAAQHHAIVNATEGGAHIDGCDDIPLADIVAQLPERERMEITLPQPVKTDRVLSDLKRSASDLLQTDSIMPDCSIPFLNNWIAGLVMRSRWREVPEADIRKALEQGCRDILEAVP